MKLKMFDVVKLEDNNKATILSVNNDSYIAEIVDNTGKTVENKTITNSDIKELLYRRLK